MSLTPEEVADRAASEAKKDPKVRALIQDVHMYDGLAEHAGWRHLRNKFGERRDLYLEKLSQRLWRGDEIDLREIDFQRGYYQGITDLLDDPETVMDKLELAGKLAWVRAQLRGNEVEGEDSPYG